MFFAVFSVGQKACLKSALPTREAAEAHLRRIVANASAAALEERYAIVEVPGPGKTAVPGFTVAAYQPEPVEEVEA